MEVHTGAPARQRLPCRFSLHVEVTLEGIVEGTAEPLPAIGRRAGKVSWHPGFVMTCKLDH